MLQQRIVNRFFSGVLVRRVGKEYAVIVDAANIAGLDDRKVAINRIARCYQVETPPQACLRLLFQPWSNKKKQRNREKRGCRNQRANLLAAHPEQQDHGHRQVEDGHNGRNLERL